MKTYTITVNGNVYDVTVEEGTGAAPAPAAIQRQLRKRHRKQLRQHQKQLRQQAAQAQ